MRNRIKVAIAGYGNLGKGVEKAVKESPDMELVGVFTRRDPERVKLCTQGVDVLPADLLREPGRLARKPDVLLVCGGSAKDLPWQSPMYARHYNIVDSFDNHAGIYEHFKGVDTVAKSAGTTAIIGVGWDPGLFSYNRAMSECVMAKGRTYTFWGKGISQGHSDAIRSIEGVIDARQYTIPNEGLLEKIRTGEALAGLSTGSVPELSAEKRHERECFVVIEKGTDEKEIRNAIINMPDYFAGYKTKVNFISEEELKAKHDKMPHGGTVIRKSEGVAYEFSLKLESNPEFTASVLTAYARAAYRISAEGGSGCRTILDVPLTYISLISHEEMIKNFL